MADPATRLILLPGSAAAGDALTLHRWLPQGPPRAAILLSHGYAEHGGCYAPLAAAFNAAGYAVYAIDHWGHGTSDGVGGFVPQFSVYRDGLDALVAQVRAEQGDAAPLFLVGHSMGGLIAADYLIDHQHDFIAAALSGPALAPAKRPSRLMKAASRILSRYAPKMGVLSLNGDAVSRDPAVVAAYRSDPLVYRGKISARLGHEMLQAMEHVTQQRQAIQLPMFIQHGGADQITAVGGSEQFFVFIGSVDKQIQIYDGLFHEIYNEPERAEVIADLITWCDRHLPPAA